MLWQNWRFRAAIPAVAIAAMLSAKWQLADKHKPRVLLRDHQAFQEPHVLQTMPQLLAIEEHGSQQYQDSKVQPVSELHLQPAQHELGNAASELGAIIYEPQETRDEAYRSKAIARSEQLNRYTSEGRTQVKVAPKSQHIEPILSLPDEEQPTTVNLRLSSPQAAQQSSLQSVLQSPRNATVASRQGAFTNERMTERDPNSAEMAPVNQLALQHVQKGFSLGDRNAFYAARVEFMQALQIIGQAVDAHHNRAPNDANSCSQALSRALEALREAEDFVPVQGKLAGDLDLENIIAAHRTPVAKAGVPVSQMAALQSYFDYARDEFITAGVRNPVASQAFAGLGKCCINDAQETTRGLASAKGMVFHQAALATDGSNHLAANELGVLLGKYGQWSEAKRMFLQAARVREDAATWQNLAVAHDQLGEQDLARLAVSESRRLQNSPEPRMTAIDGSPTVQWVDPRAFGGPPEEMRASPGAQVANRTPVPTSPSQRNTTGSSSSSWWKPWR